MSFQYRQSPTRSPKKAFQTSQLAEAVNTRFPLSGNKRYSPHSTMMKSFASDPQTQEKSLKQSVDELDFYRQRCRDLEIQNHKLEQAYIGTDSRSLEIERTQKQLAQKRNEADLWKQKYENSCGQLMQVKANYELEVQQLSLEVQRLLARIEDAEFERQVQVEQCRQGMERNLQTQIDGMKKQQQQQRDTFELQSKALREQLESRDENIAELLSKLDRLRVECDSEVIRVHRDCDLLRARLTQQEVDRQRELQDVRQRIEGFSSSTLDNLRKTHSNSMDVMEGEIEKVRSLLDLKNTEIDTLLQQNMKNKQHLEQQYNEVRMEAEGLKEKLLEKEHLHHEDLQNLQRQIQDEQEDSVTQFKQHYEQSIKTLEQEVRNLHELINRKNDELQSLANDILQERQQFEESTESIHRDYQDLQGSHQTLLGEIAKERDNSHQETNRLYDQINEMRDQLRNQGQLMDTELGRQREQSNHRIRELENRVRLLEEENRQIFNENELIRIRHQEFEKLKNIEIEDHKNKWLSQDQLHRERSRQYEIKIDNLVNEQRRQRDQYEQHTYDLENAIQTVGMLEKETNRLKEENDDLKDRVIQTERDKTKELEELRIKLESSSIYQIENLKTAFNTQLNILNGENSDLKQTLESRTKSIDEMIQKYQSLEKAISTGTYGPEVIANRSIYDVYVRSKVRISSVNKRT